MTKYTTQIDKIRDMLLDLGFDYFELTYNNKKYECYVNYVKESGESGEIAIKY